MCERGSHVTLFINDQYGGRFWNIDRCIARLVQMLLELKVGVIQACCGHGDQPIQILFARGKDNFAYDIVLKLNPIEITPREKSGWVIAKWDQLPEEEMYGWAGLYTGDDSVKGRKCLRMFIDEHQHPTWWADMPENVFPLVQMLRELRVHTTNFHATPNPEEICLYFNRGEDNSAYEIVKGFAPDELTPPEQKPRGDLVATWQNITHTELTGPTRANFWLLLTF